MKQILISGVLLLCLTANSFAIYSPRAMGMGQAFTAIADDAFAAYYNPAGFAINPGVDVSGNYQINNRNQAAGDNVLALKGCFEIGLDPFAWMMGVGLVSAFAYEGAQYLADQGIVKKGWGREGEKFSKEDSQGMSEKVDEGGTEQTTVVSKKEAARQAAKVLTEGTIHVTKEFAHAALEGARRQTRAYFYVSPLFAPNYYRPSYWDYRYDYKEKELTPAGKAQFGGGITVMSDQNASSTVDLNTNWYSFSIASGYGEIAALGTNLNIYDLSKPSSGRKGLGAGLDVGALVRISNVLMFGAVAKELLTTDIHWDNNTNTRYMTQFNLGLGLKPIQQVLVTADMHNVFAQNGQDPTAHYGVEVKPVYGLALRAGLDNNNKTAGISLGIGQLIVDYAYLGGTYNRTQMIGATWKI